MASSGSAVDPLQMATRQDEQPGRAPADPREIGAELVAAVRDGANAIYEEQRNRIADEIAAAGEVLRRSAQSLQRDGTAAARYADDAGQQIGDFADRLRGLSWAELTADVAELARRWPLLFLGSAAGIGFVACRLLLASPPATETDGTPSSPSGPSGDGQETRARPGPGSVSESASAGYAAGTDGSG
jgi:hypothetical protein